MACSGGAATVSRTITSAQIGTPAARLTGYFTSWTGSPEVVPGALNPEVIRDEATLQTLTDTQTCVDLTLRTEYIYDQPFGQLGMLCQFGETSQDYPARPQSERVTVSDYHQTTGTVVTLWADGVSQEEYVDLALAEVPADQFRVVQRSGRVCCDQGSRWQATLEVRNGLYDPNAMTPHSQAFNWVIGQPMQ